MKTLHFITTVTATAPKGYKPRTLTVKGLCVSNKPNAAALLKSKAEEKIKANFKKTYPDIEFDFKATHVPIRYEFFIVETEEVIPEGGEDTQTEPTNGEAPKVAQAEPTDGEAPKVAQAEPTDGEAPENKKPKTKK